MKIKYFLLFSLSALIFLHLGCGPQSPDRPTCTPNVIDTGLTLLVTNLGSNSYSFQLCAPANPPSVYTVYGGIDNASLTPPNVNAAWRQSSITNTNDTGKVFQVTFHTSDNSFAIFQDKSNGSGGFALDNTKVMVLARTLPGH